jgi:hypothetical protein
MNKLSFFYRQQQVYEMSLKALQRRKFAILEADEKSGIIKARSRGGMLKPGVRIELQISEVNERQTSMNIESRMKRSWLSPAGYDEAMEAKFIRTLYNCFDTV